MVIVMVSLMLLMAFGYWGQGSQLAQPPAPESPSAEAPPASTPPDTTLPPGVNPLSPNFSVADARRHIDRSAGTSETMLMTVYYADGLKNAESLQPVEMRLQKNPGTVRAAAEQVLYAPVDYKLYSSVPDGTKIRSVDFNQATGVATVEVSPELETVQGSAAAANIMASFVYTLTALPEVKAVQLMVGNRPALLHEIEWTKPITRAEMDAKAYFMVEPVIKFSPGP
jgi:spore germination protein GerM